MRVGRTHSPVEMSTYSVLLKTMILLRSHAWYLIGSVGVGGSDSVSVSEPAIFGLIAPNTGIDANGPGNF